MCIKMRRGRSTAARVIATMAGVAVLSGCAMKGDIRDLQVEIRALAARQDSLLAEFRAETQDTQDTLRTQSDQMFEFRGDINQSLRQIGQSLNTLEAMVGENQRGIAGVRDQLANQRRTPVAQPRVIMTDSTATASGGSERLIGGGGNADQLWAIALQQLDRESLNSATRAFEQFLAEYPGDDREADAHFNLADILTQQDRPEDALEAFQEIQVLFPTAARVPDAMYRIALLQIELGDTEQAKTTLERIMNTYPDASVAMLARDTLADIG